MQCFWFILEIVVITRRKNTDLSVKDVGKQQQEENLSLNTYAAQAQLNRLHRSLFRSGPATVSGVAMEHHFHSTSAHRSGSVRPQRGAVCRKLPFYGSCKFTQYQLFGLKRYVKFLLIEGRGEARAFLRKETHQNGQQHRYKLKELTCQMSLDNAILGDPYEVMISEGKEAKSRSAELSHIPKPTWSPLRESYRSRASFERHSDVVGPLTDRRRCRRRRPPATLEQVTTLPLSVSRGTQSLNAFSDSEEAEI
ncbi:unnamed protein product, partial [Nippostrongylus brasiliensis]|uniref:IRS-type PTB domain-containing protein n=1 Tax=Nippostrongylus brasiliensis TaxID=27835 RepID=A0A158R2M5_NIPBR